MSEFNENSLFNDPGLSAGDARIPIERLNRLLFDQAITPDEHEYLLRTIYSFEKRISIFSWACFLTAAVMWISLMNFTFNGNEYSLMSGHTRFWVGTILTPAIIALFFLSRRDMKLNNDVGGMELSISGLTLGIGWAVVLIPTWIMKIYAG